MFRHLFSDQPDSAARTFWYSSCVWFLVGTTMGLLASLYFVSPNVMRGVAPLSFGRLRPIHVNVVAFGWISMAHLGTMYYILPRLCRSRLYSERLANFIAWAWNGTILFAIVSLFMGFTEGKEYAELVAPLDILVMVALLLTTFNVLMTIANRREPLMYVSLWYFAGTVCWYPVIYFLGNRTFFATNGLNDAIVGWFYGHNTLGLWFTTMGIGATYYLLPRLVNKPIYSHLLSLIGFWTVAIFYAPIGAHHTLQAPIPEWLKAIASTSSALMVIPVITVLVNFFKTMDNEWHKVPGNTPLKFLTMAMISYLVTCIQGPLQASRAINAYLHFSQWVVGHAHMALLGTFSFIQMAFIYYALPRVLKRPIYSERIANVQFWAGVLSFFFFFVALTIAGLQQAAGWSSQIMVQYTSLWLKPMYLLRTFSAVILVFTFYLFVYNVYMTVRSAAREQARAGAETAAA
ncbi:MAG: cbb3-type cytochrome c oxidase subunit I [Fimbriimonadaceae bacterium]|nr:cbb3-type cytochrome c oxidase subunit I [Fimbriimonadaceae bacterium]